MNRHRAQALAVATISSGLFAFGLAAPPPARAASMMEVPRATWANGVTLPSYLQMYVYAPDKMASKPPIVVSAHACGSTAMGQIGNITKIKAAADTLGFVLVFPDNPNQNCWDVGTSASLKHDGGGDTQGIATMVKYALMKYSGDPSRVYIHGGSSGAMLTQAMLAVYPDVFRAGAARAGVPAGCWAVSYASSNQWSDPCSGGSVSHTAKEWGDMVRMMFPSYTGHRPRVQLMQGTSDGTINYKNMGESIKEWTNVLGLPETPTSTDMSFKGAVTTWNRQFWKNSCGYQVLEAWSAPGQGHSMGYEEDAILKFFGLDVAMDTDPEPNCDGSGGGGASGGTGSGGSTGADGGPPKDGGAGGSTDGGHTDAAATGSGGTTGGNGGATSSGSGGTEAGSGGATSSSSGGSSASGGKTGSGGSALSSGGTSGGSGGATSSGGSPGSGGSASQGSGGSGSPPGAGGGGSSGCACAVGGDSAIERSASGLGTLLMAASALVIRRRRRARGPR